MNTTNAINTIYTVAIGDRYTKTRWARDCLKAWEDYCARHNLNLHVQTQATYPFKEHSADPKFEKFNFMHQPFDGSILVVDIDTVPTPDMPNLFELHSNRNITCRVNPNWGPGHHFFLWSQPERFDALFAGLSWPLFSDVVAGGGGGNGRHPMCGFMSAAVWYCCRRMCSRCSRKIIRESKPRHRCGTRFMTK
ncbi:MAG: hypothetical protein OXU71_02830 [Gammaproteobacteria bacterium]|nr:hypothetical protein [Gammaproteobacteria bacterium]